MIDYVGLEFLFDIWFFFGGRDGVDDITFTTLFQEVMGRVRDKYRPEAIVLQVFTPSPKKNTHTVDSILLLTINSFYYLSSCGFGLV